MKADVKQSAFHSSPVYTNHKVKLLILGWDRRICAALTIWSFYQKTGEIEEYKEAKEAKIDVWLVAKLKGYFTVSVNQIYLSKQCQTSVF